MDGVESRLLHDVTEDEQDFGFGIAEEPSGACAVIRELRPGLLAVKVRAEDGRIEYAICNADLHPLYPPARTLEELRMRFYLP